eukprot:1802173-Prymnesium_polylepis.1
MRAMPLRPTSGRLVKSSADGEYPYHSRPARGDTHVGTPVANSTDAVTQTIARTAASAGASVVAASACARSLACSRDALILACLCAFFCESE